MSALGVSTAVCYEDQYESSTVSSQTSQSTLSDPSTAQIADTEQILAVGTRAKRSDDEPKSFISRSTQSEEALVLSDVDMIPNFSTRMNKNGRACHPRYLQAGLLMMALNNQSSRQAVMNMYIMDKIVYRQKRMLPIRLRKDYQKQLQFLKKYRSRSDVSQKENDLITQIGPGSVNFFEEETPIGHTDASVEDTDDDLFDHVMDEAADDIDFNIDDQVGSGRKDNADSDDIQMVHESHIESEEKVSSSHRDQYFSFKLHYIPML